MIERFIEALPAAIVCLDERFTIRSANGRACRLLGSHLSQLRGRSLLDLVDDQHGTARRFLRQASTTSQPLPGPLQLKSVNGSRPLTVHAAAFHWNANRVIVLRCVEQLSASRAFRDLGERLQTLTAELYRERRLQRELQEALDERNALLDEVHHRVRNHLQITSSLLNLQMSGVGPGPAQVALRDTQARINALAVVHNWVFSQDSLHQIDLSRLLPGLARTIVDMFSAGDRVAVSSSLPTWPMSVTKASPMALLASEAVTNALKHGFPDERAGTISFGAWITDDRRVLRIADDGVGMGRQPGAPDKRSIGLDLMRSLAGQLRAKLEIESNGGVEIRLTLAPVTHD